MQKTGSFAAQAASLPDKRKQKVADMVFVLSGGKAFQRAVQKMTRPARILPDWPNVH